jgi:hypothetical protein
MLRVAPSRVTWKPASVYGSYITPLFESTTWMPAASNSRTAASSRRWRVVGLFGPVLGNPLPRRLSVVGTDAPRLSLEAELLEPLVTVDQTARLRVTWTNPLSQEVGIGSTYLPVSETGESHETDLVLAEPSYDFAGQTWAGCWKLTEMGGPAGAGPDAYLGPDDSLSIEYDVWTAPDEDECFPLGEYQFGPFESGYFGSREQEERCWPVPSWTLTLAVEDA